MQLRGYEKYADFSGSDVSGMNFTSGFYEPLFELYAVNFSNATAVGASFRHSDLTGANFAGADLTNANFAGANLTGANFTGATITGVQWTWEFSGVTCPDGTVLTTSPSDTCVGHLTAT